MREFAETVKRKSLRKPVIIWKGGSTSRGAQATASHTGALAVPSGIWNGIVRQTGIIPAENISDIINLCRALIWNPLPQGPGIGLICQGGGISVQMTDYAVKEGLVVPVLTPYAQKKLGEFISRVNTSIDNPIDMGAASYLPEKLLSTFTTLAADERIHSFILNYWISPFKDSDSLNLEKIYLKAIKDARDIIDKPIYVFLNRPFRNFSKADDIKRKTIKIFNEMKVPYTMEIQDCVKMVRRLSDYSLYLQSRT